MDSLRLRGFRSLKDTQQVELRPITLLLGKNSSGKSTFLRSFPLLKQSLRTRSNAPVLWYGDLVDFGSYDEVRTNDDSIDFIRLGFGFYNSPLRVGGTYDYRRVETRFICNLQCTLKLGSFEGATRLRGTCIEIDGDRIELDVDGRNTTTAVHVNSIDWSPILKRIHVRLIPNEIAPQVSYQSLTPSARDSSLLSRGTDLIEEELARFLRPYLGNRIAFGNILKCVRRARYAPYDQFPEVLAKTKNEFVTWNRFLVNYCSYDNEVLRRLHAYYTLMSLPDITAHINRRLSQRVINSAYVGPSRATGERYYRFQELSVDQIDPQGRNMAMFLNSLARQTFNRFSIWMRENFGYDVKLDRSAGHVQVLLRDEQSEKFFNIADMGYGFSQVLPVLVQLWSSRTRGRSGAATIAIEQPELHLHPAYQSRLADLFASVASPIPGSQEGVTPSDDKTVRLIIETHSEAMVNRFGELVGRGRLKPSDLAIYRFEKDELTNLSSVHRSEFLEDGSLDCWPIGFFSAVS